MVYNSKIPFDKERAQIYRWLSAVGGERGGDAWLKRFAKEYICITHGCVVMAGGKWGQGLGAGGQRGGGDGKICNSVNNKKLLK